MKLWILRPINGLPPGDDPWEPWYDCAFGFIVRAETEQEAREFAQADAGDEEKDTFLDNKKSNTKTPWMEPKYSTCLELLPDGEPGVIMQDFHAA